MLYIHVHCAGYPLPLCPLCRISSNSLSTVQNIINSLYIVQNIIYLRLHCAEYVYHLPLCPLCRISFTSMSIVQNIIYLYVHCAEYHLPPCPLCRISSTALSTVQNIIYLRVHCTEYPSPYPLCALVPSWPVCLKQWSAFVRRQINRLTN